MNSRDFCYWLQGYFEIHNVNMPENMKASQGGLTNHQADLIQKHLAMVFVHEIDPSYPEREKLDAIHAAPKPLTPEEALELLKAKPQRPPNWTGGSHGPDGFIMRC